MPDQRSGNISQKTPSTERLRAMEAILPGFEQSVQEQVAVSQRRVRDAEALVNSQADLLHAAVKAAANPDSTGDKHAIAALRDHWWVERAEKGEWIAMDVRRFKSPARPHRTAGDDRHGVRSRIRTVLQSSNSSSNKEVQAYRRLWKVLKKVQDDLGGVP